MEQQQVPWLNLEYFFNKFFDFVENFFPFVDEKLRQIFGAELGFAIYFAYLGIVLGAVGVIFVVYKLIEIKWLRKKVYFSDFFAKDETPLARKDNWAFIKKQLDSEEQDKWKLAIVEADIFIDNLMERIGYRGMTLGDKIKSINPKNFSSVKELFEAHVVRRKIGQGGEEFQITQEEAKETLEKFEKALKELKYL